MIDLTIFISLYKKSEAQLNRALTSIPDEINVVIDCDGWIPNYKIEDMESYKSHNKIKVNYHKFNRGLAKLRNYQIESCMTEYMQFLDADDYINGSVLYHIDDSIDGAFMVTPVAIHDKNGVAIERRNCNVCNTKQTYFIIPSIIFDTKFLQGNEDLRFDESGHLFEDILFSINLSKYCLNCDIEDYTYYHYINDEDDSTLSHPIDHRRSINDTLWFMSKIVELSGNKPNTIIYSRLVEEGLRVLTDEQSTDEDKQKVINFIKPYKYF